MKRIALIGPESSGKTTLATQLADYYVTTWIPEYAREYVEALNRPYQYEDVVHIARKQIEQLKQTNDTRRFLFFDTELIITKIWFLDVYKTCPAWLDEAIRNQNFALYLLCSPDIAWTPDPVRENPDRRNYFFELYRSELENYSFKYKIVEGHGNERIENAIAILDQL